MITGDQAINALRRANPAVDERQLPQRTWTASVLLEDTARRMEMKTHETRATKLTKLEPRQPKRPRWALVAGAAFVGVLAVVGVAALVGGGGSGSDPADPPTTTAAPTTTTIAPTTSAVSALAPLEVIGLYNAAVAAGDWTSVRALYADSAELQVENATETIVPRIALTDFEPRTPYDWDGDGLVNGFDGLIDDGVRHFAAGTTTFVSCLEVDAATVACEEVWEGFAFRRSNHVPTTWTLTIVDGEITAHVIGIVPRSEDPIDRDVVNEYHAWVIDNMPEFASELFESPDRLNLTPETAVTHNELIAQWLASR